VCVCVCVCVCVWRRQQAVVRYATLAHALVNDQPARAAQVAAAAAGADNRDDLRAWVARNAGGRRWDRRPLPFEHYHLDAAAQGAVYRTRCPHRWSPSHAAVCHVRACVCAWMRASLCGRWGGAAGRERQQRRRGSCVSIGCGAPHLPQDHAGPQGPCEPPSSVLSCTDNVRGAVGDSGVTVCALRDGRVHGPAMYRVPHCLSQELRREGTCARRAREERPGEPLTAEVHTCMFVCLLVCVCVVGGGS
jgi:hypothetical protein